MVIVTEGINVYYNFWAMLETLALKSRTARVLQLSLFLFRLHINEGVF